MSTLKILLVDDHDDFRRSLNLYLNAQQDVEVIGEAGDGFEAVRQVERLRPDLVLMDLEMPVKDGFEATREIKTRWPNIRVIILSVYASEVYRRAALEYLADGFIDKNAMKHALLAMLMEEHARRADDAVNAA